MFSSECHKPKPGKLFPSNLGSGRGLKDHPLEKALNVHFPDCWITGLSRFTCSKSLCCLQRGAGVLTCSSSPSCGPGPQASGLVFCTGTKGDVVYPAWDDCHMVKLLKLMTFLFLKLFVRKLWLKRNHKVSPHIGFTIVSLQEATNKGLPLPSTQSFPFSPLPSPN